MIYTRLDLLDNMFCALDRLYDSKAKVVDIYSLAYATTRALTPADPLAPFFDSATVELNNILADSFSDEDARLLAVEGTNALREKLAYELRDPAL